jgi:lipopolysaccharide export system permease protein
MTFIIHRYIAKTILTATFFVVAVVTGLAFFIGLLGELKDIGVGDYGFMQAVIHTFLRLPYSIYQFFPMLVLVGGLMGLGMLAANRELIVMRAAGISIFKVMLAVVSAALILIVSATLVGEFIAPHANFLADKRKDSAENFGQAVATASGVWIHEGNNFLHIEKVNGLEHLEGVTRYEFNAGHRLLSAYYAKFVDYASHGQWSLRQVVKTSFSNDKTSSQKLETGSWNLALNPNLLNVGLIAPEEMTLYSLAKYSKHLVDNKLQATNFQFEFWKRVFQPLTTLVMILLAIPFVFGAPRSVTMGWRILSGVMVGFVFYIFNALLGQFSVVFQVSPFVAALLPTLLFALAGYILLMRIR